MLHDFPTSDRADRGTQRGSHPRSQKGSQELDRRAVAGLVLETERLTLRRPTLADAPAVARLAGDPKVCEMTRRLPYPYRLEHAVELIAALDQTTRDNDLMFLIEHLHAPVGIVGVDWRVPEAPELGYWLGVDHWGRGFATEAARAVIDVAFEVSDTPHLASGARVANPASRNVLEKCGFQWSGVELHRFEALGSSTPVDCFRLSRTIWASLKTWNASTRHET